MENRLIQQIWPEWEIDKELGQGSFGTVYRAVRQEGTIKSVAAIKVISVPRDRSEVDDLYSEGMTEEEITTYFKNVIDDFSNEIGLMEQLKGHPNVVAIEDFRIEKKRTGIGWDILVRMEALEPFTEYLRNHTLSEKEIIAVGCDLLTALAVCEEANIIHRDVKPENIFVNRYGNFKLGDFGIAKRFEALGASHSQKGTSNYMAPEVANGSHYDARVDIYSLGLVLYRLANNNCLPFLTDTNKTDPKARSEALQRRLTGERIPRPACRNDQLAEVILKATAFDPADRFATADAFKQALCAAEKGTYIAAAVPDPFSPETDDLDKTAAVRKARVHDEPDDSQTRRVRKKPTPTPPGDDDDGKKEKKKRKAVLPVMVILLCCLLVIGILAVVLRKYGFGKEDGEDTSAQTGDTTAAADMTDTDTETAETTAAVTTADTAEETTVGVTTTEETTAAPELLSISLAELPAKAEYYVGDPVEPAGLQLELAYSDGSTETVCDGFTCSPAVFTEAGTQQVTVSYGEMTVVYDVTVVAVILESIELRDMPAVTVYTVGDTLNMEGLTLTAHNSNGADEIVTSGFLCSPTTLHAAGTQTITVSYGGMTVCFSVTVNKEPLPGISRVNVGDRITFGSYEQDNVFGNGTELITWRILAKDADRVLVISEYALDVVPYHTSNTGITWETCSLRAWLNGTFLSSAFDSNEQARIRTVAVPADRNPSYGTSPGNTVYDRVFLLGVSEAERYFPSDEARRCAPTAYAVAKGAATSGSSLTADGAASCWWWLRSPGVYQNYAANIHHSGSVDHFGFYVSDTSECVRPALWIALDP